jgi:acetyl esterase
MARDRSGPALRFQWLDVPATDATLSTEGHRNVSDGYLLDASSIDEYLDAYLPDRPTQSREPYCSPLLADDLSGLPPARIITCGFDKLRGDGEAYAARLAEAGVAAEHVRLDGHVHPSFAFTRLVPSAAANERESIAALAAALA